MGRVSLSDFISSLKLIISTSWASPRILLSVPLASSRINESTEVQQGAIVFMASDASKFMTGSEIRVDGGYCVI